MKRNSSWVTAMILLVLAPGAAVSEDLDKALQKGELRTQQGAQAQKRVDAVYEETRQRVEEYKALLKQIEGIQVYNQQLQAQVNRQEDELRQIDQSLESVTQVDREISPLMTKMVDVLDQFLVLDLPFLAEERRGRVANLQDMMTRADVTVAEQFRFVLSAYNTEMKYGTTIEAYRGNLDGENREVDILRIGRLGLYYQTLDGKESGHWRPEKKAWEALPTSYNGQIQRGIRMAREQAAPDLIRLPVQTAEAQS